MGIKSISFENYKGFAEKQTLEIKPITILIGKNSTGKSSVAKLLTLLESSLSFDFTEPVLFNNDGVELGAEFRDLTYNRGTDGIVLSVTNPQNEVLSVKLIQEASSLIVRIYEWQYNDFKITYSPEGHYFDSTGKIYDCEFKGFIPKHITTRDGNILYEPKMFISWKIDVDYIGPFRVLPDRQFYLTGKIKYNNTGAKGENAYAMLAVSLKQDPSLVDNVSNWYKQHFDGWGLMLRENPPFFQVLLNKRIGGESHETASPVSELEINIVDVGQGMNQALPLIVRANTKRISSIIVLEQPELHLHPAAHGDLAELFASSAIKSNQNYLIETHSENIILRLRRLVVSNDFGLKSDDVIIYSLESDSNSGLYLKKITIDEDGELSDWPTGVFAENFQEIIDIHKAIEKRKNDHTI